MEGSAAEEGTPPLQDTWSSLAARTIERDPDPVEPGPKIEADTLPSAAEFCGDRTGISTDGIKHCLARFGLVGDAFKPQPIQGEFIVDTGTGPGAGVAYRNSPAMDDRTTDGGGPTVDMHVTAISQTPEWIEVEGGRWLPKKFLKPAMTTDPRQDVTTSDLCHAHIKPATVPRGWVDEPELLRFDEAGNDISRSCWYKHVYRRLSSQEVQSEPPPGTRSMCAELAADPATAEFVGRPTHFLSHAWLYKILDVVEALDEFEASQPDRSPPIFWWFDCFAIDEVCRTQSLSTAASVSS